MAQPISVPADVTLPELTFRGVLLGALITVIFTASNVFLGLKVGLTFVRHPGGRDLHVRAAPVQGRQHP